MEPTARVIIADDQNLVRLGIAKMLELAGIEVVATAQDAQELLDLVGQFHPDVVLTDIEMPPNMKDDGVDAAKVILQSFPETGVILLSQYLDARYAIELMGARATGVGYLLKEKISSPDVLLDAVTRVASGGIALDADVILKLVSRKRLNDPIEELTSGELEVLRLMAEGHSNIGIAKTLFVTVPAIERHITSIFLKLEIRQVDSSQHRRVLAVLHYLNRR